MPGMGANLGQFFKPEDLLNAYKNMECEVPDGTAIVAINRYRNANKPSHAEGGTQESWPLRLSLLGVAPDTIKRTGGNKLWADCFLGKGSPWAIARVLECFVAYSDQWIARFKKAHAATPERKIADWLSDDNLSWEAALQKISDGWFGLDCNGFTGNWFKVNCPDFKLTPDDRADEVRQKQAKVYRKSLDEIDYWDVMCYTKNEHIALVNSRVDANGHFMVAQSAGGGPRMNEFAFLQTGTKTFRLAAPSRNDIGYEFYVISLW